MAHATSAHIQQALPATCQTKICLFCCKVIPTAAEDQSDGYNNNELLHRFFKILERQLRTKNNKPSTTERDNNNSLWTQFLPFLQNQVHRENNVNNNNGKVKKNNGCLSVECCGDCLEVVETLLKLFHELKCLELKWEWRLDTLLKKMKLGGRVASRQKTLKTLCDNQDNNYFGKSQKVKQNVAININRAGLSSYKRLVSFRGNVIRKCSMRRSKMYPKLILDRFPCHMKVEPVPTPQSLNNPTPMWFITSVELPPSTPSMDVDFEEEEIGDVDDEDYDDIEMKPEIHEDQFQLASSASDDDDETEKEISGNESPHEDEVELSEKHKKPGKKGKPLKRCSEEMDTSTFSYKCDFPNYTVERPTPDSLLYHKRKIHQVEGPNKKSIRCGKYSTNFGTKFLLPHPHHQLAVHGNANNDNGNGDVTLQKKKEKAKAKKELEPLQCETPDCYQRFTLPEELENHSKLHGNFLCGKCDTVFTFAQDLPIHEAKHHCAPLELEETTMEGEWTPANGFRCLHCEKEIKSKAKWKYLYVKHVLKAHLNLPCATLICPICRKTYFPLITKSRTELRKTHFTQCHDISSMDPKDVHRCDHEQCQAYFKTAVQLNHHKNQDHPKQLKCHYCEKTFQNRDLRRKHLRRKHKAVFSFTCDIENCKTRFPDEEDLAHHRTFYHHFYQHFFSGHPGKRMAKEPKKSLVCEQCGKFFKTKTKLKHHSLSHSGPDSWKFCCETCGKKCISAYKLAEHELTHTKEQPFQCEICGEKYTQRHNLRSHVNRKHTDVTQDLPQKYANQEKRVNKRQRKSNKHTKSPPSAPSKSNTDD